MVVFAGGIFALIMGGDEKFRRAQADVTALAMEKGWRASAERSKTQPTGCERGARYEGLCTV